MKRITLSAAFILLITSCDSNNKNTDVTEKTLSAAEASATAVMD